MEEKYVDIFSFDSIQKNPKILIVGDDYRKTANILRNIVYYYRESVRIDVPNTATLANPSIINILLNRKNDFDKYDTTLFIIGGTTPEYFCEKNVIKEIMKKLEYCESKNTIEAYVIKKISHSNSIFVRNFDYIFFSQENDEDSVKYIYNNYYKSVFLSFESFRKEFIKLTDNFGSIVMDNYNKNKLFYYR